MLTLKDWMEIVDYRITEGSEFGWKCYGDNVYCLDSWNCEQDGYSFTVIFDTRTQEVYEVQAHDYFHNRAYRMINPAYKNAQQTKASEMGSYADEAWDDVDYVDLEVDDDFIQKCLAIKTGEDYDTRVSIPVDFTDEELLKYMKMAHERDMTFNQFVEEAIREAMKEYERNPEELKRKAAILKSQRESEPHGY